MSTPASSSDAVGRKRKRIVLTISDKLKICEMVSNGRSLTSVAKEFDTSKSTIHDIVNNQDKLQTLLTEIQDGGCINNRRIVRRADLVPLEKAVYMWFVQLRCKGTPICGPLLMAKALQLYPLIYPNDSDPSSFKGLKTGMELELCRFKENRSLQLQKVSIPSRNICQNSLRRRAYL